MLSQLGRLLQEIVFPTRCVGCSSPEGWLCERCLAITGLLPSNRCRLCAAPYSGGDRCRNCRDYRPAFERMLVERPFVGPVREAVHQFKFENVRYLAPTLAALMSDELSTLPEGTTVLAVPLHKDRLRERGYNQSGLIAGQLALRLGLLLADNLLVRTRPTKPQMSLPPAERRLNVKGAFAAVEGALMPKIVLLVDDVVTTGSTMSECAGVLKAAGVERVIGAAVARAV